MKNNELIHKGFLYSALGVDKPEHHALITRLEEEALQRSAQYPKLLSKLGEACRRGRHAHTLAQHLEKKIKQGQESEVQEWLKKIKDSNHAWIGQHLDKKLEKAERHKQSLQQHRHPKTRSVVTTSTLKPVALQAGQHPNSVRHLPPSQQWQILIDETGSEFSSIESELTTNDSTLGRVVALVLRHGTQLKPLPKNFHAKDSPPKYVDQVLEELLNKHKQVGIFGFTVNDPLAFGGYWISHIQRLIRWVLYLLPIEPKHPTKVQFFIEQNAGFDPSTDLNPLADLLQDELRAIDAKRFGNLFLSIEIIEKTGHPYNGYVDTIAFTWGSPKPAPKDRLKKSALLGHCLLHPNSDYSLERLYLALNAQGQLAPSDWYELCVEAAQETEGGLLRNFLTRWGEKVTKETGLWYSCLQEVRQHLQSKRYRLPELGAALEWLNAWTPAGVKLSKPLQLQMETARLAVENHHGGVNPKRIIVCLKLADELIDECAAEVCEVYLRLTVMATNHFEFSLMRSYLEPWFAEPIAVPGLANLGKLYSTLGQLDAFEHRPDAALQQFDKALQIFSRLSDAQQIQRESLQTQTYHLIAQMDSEQVADTTLRAALTDYLTTVTHKPSMEQAVRSLACSGEPSRRFAHHLLLRAFIAHPDLFTEEHHHYLARSAAWQTDTYHPWPLIDAYRAWLLCLTGHSEQAASYLQHAIDCCAHPNNGVTLHWMAEVLRTLAYSLDLAVDSQPSEEARQALSQRLLPAPHEALSALLSMPKSSSHKQRWIAFGHCLPFNFR